MKNLFYLVVISVITWSCNGGLNSGGIPNTVAISSLYQVALITSPEMRDEPVIDTIDYYYASAYPLLPQPEPYFDLRLFTPDQLEAERTRRELKVYLIISDLSVDDKCRQMMVNDLGESILDEEEGIKVVRNKWAQEQMVAYIYAQDQETLINLIKKSYSSLSKRIEDFYNEQIDASAYIGGKALGTNKLVRDKLDVDMDFPEGFNIAKEDSTYLWLRRDTEKGIENITIEVLNYDSPKQFSREEIKAHLNRVGRKVSSSSAGSYKLINDIDLPLLLSQSDIGDNYAVLAQGIWEMRNDFMGGPFCAYFVLDEEKQRIILLEAFVFAPGEKKRNKMILLEHVLRSIRI